MADYQGKDFYKDEISIIKQSSLMSGGLNAAVNKPIQELADRTTFVKNRLGHNDIVWFDDEAAVPSVGTKRTYYVPFDMTLEVVNLQAVTAPTSDVVIDVHVAGSSIFTASGQPTLNGANFTDTILDTTSGGDTYLLTKDQKLEIIVDDAGTGAAGLKVTVIGNRRF